MSSSDGPGPPVVESWSSDGCEITFASTSSTGNDVKVSVRWSDVVTAFASYEGARALFTRQLAAGTFDVPAHRAWAKTLGPGWSLVIIVHALARPRVRLSQRRLFIETGFVSIQVLRAVR